MDASKTKVALLFGGCSGEHEVSLVSAAAVFRNLDRKKYTVRSIYIHLDGRWAAVDSPLLPRLEMEKIRPLSFLPWKNRAADGFLKADIYFPVLHGPNGEDGTIQGLFDLAGVPYVGAGVLSSSVSMDKDVAKTLFRAAGLPTVGYMTILEPEWAEERNAILDRILSRFRVPVFVKPANLGSSVGISKVKELDRVEKAVRLAFQFDRKVLVEQGVVGREIECAVLGNDRPQASLPGELLPHREFYDYRDKYIEGKTTFKIPAPLRPAQVRRVQELAVRAFRSVDGSGMARVDFLMDQTGRFYVSEINTIPGFTEISMYPKLWEASGLPFPRLLDRLIELGFDRYRMRTRKKRRSGR